MLLMFTPQNTRSEFLHVTKRTHVFETSRDIIYITCEYFIPLERSGTLTRELKLGNCIIFLSPISGLTVDYISCE